MRGHDVSHLLIPLCGYISRGRAYASQFARFTEQAWSFSPPPPHVHAPCLVFAVCWLPTFAGQYSYISITFGIVNLFTIKAAMRTKRIAIFLQPINCVWFFLPRKLSSTLTRVLPGSQLSKGHKQGRPHKSSPCLLLRSHNFRWFREPSLECMKMQTYMCRF